MDGKKFTTKLWDVDKLIGAEYNPRQITEKQFEELQDSIKRFGFVDPIIVNTHEDRAGIIIAGHQRTRVAKSLGIKKIPAVELSLTLEQEKELNVRHNKSGGSFDMDTLANEFEIDELTSWGFEEWELGLDGSFEDLDEEEEVPEKVVEEVEFSEFLREENNYVVLFFDNEIDWLQAKTHFGLKTVKSKRPNGKDWSRGVGRVVNGAEYFNKLNEDV